MHSPNGTTTRIVDGYKIRDAPNSCSYSPDLSRPASFSKGAISVVDSTSTLFTLYKHTAILRKGRVLAGLRFYY
jgi:hypothetical protein